MGSDRLISYGAKRWICWRRKKIVEYIEKWPNITEKKLADRINKIFIEAFGKDVYKEDMVACSYVARKIIDNLFIWHFLCNENVICVNAEMCLICFILSHGKTACSKFWAGR